MITRLKISNFKSLVEADIRFGPFTCVAGPNGVGKSNIFDAIRFLSATATMSILEAAKSLRSEQGQAAEAEAIFFRSGGEMADTVRFEVEMIVPSSAIDDLGQAAMAKITFLKYVLELGRRSNRSEIDALGPIEVREEQLTHINQSEAMQHLWFKPNKAWVKSAVTGHRRAGPFISTEKADDKPTIVKLHQDGGKDGARQGRAFAREARALTRTVLCVTNTAENPTALCARRELESWHLLQLETSAMRKADRYDAPSEMSAHGGHLPNLLDRLARQSDDERDYEGICQEAANRLSELLAGVENLRVVSSESARTRTLMLRTTGGEEFAAQDLSDGTLRFLALVLLEMDRNHTGVVCLEEPENGIHPDRIPAMLKLLQDVSSDTMVEIGDGNPLRQVIINTHSPMIVALTPEEALIGCGSRSLPAPHPPRAQASQVLCLPDTWRYRRLGAEGSLPATVSKSQILAYLDPLRRFQTRDQDFESMRSSRRVMDRADIQPWLPSFAELPL
jgi:predicted ATPase